MFSTVTQVVFLIKNCNLIVPSFIVTSLVISGPDGVVSAESASSLLQLTSSSFSIDFSAGEAKRGNWKKIID